MDGEEASDEVEDLTEDITEDMELEQLQDDSAYDSFSSQGKREWCLNRGDYSGRLGMRSYHWLHNPGCIVAIAADYCWMVVIKC